MTAIATSTLPRVKYSPKRIKVILELTSKCNLRCGMCPLPVLRRPYEDMEWSLVEKAEREIHGNGFKMKWLHEMGEPLLYPRIGDAVRLFPEASISTNGLVLTEEVGAKLLDAGLGRLRICVDSINPAVYPMLRTGGELEKLIPLTKAFLEQAKGHPIRIEIQRMRSRMTMDESVDDFKKLFELKKYKNARVIERTCEAFDLNEETDLHGKFYGCVQGSFFTWVVIFADGRVTHCCYDAHGDQVIGDLRKNTLQEILASDQFASMYAQFEAHDLSKLPRCAECFKHGGDAKAVTGLAAAVQHLPEGAKSLVRKVIDLRYRS
ncbi:MAG TPA: radical SAM/SPASM domain-containing protein [Thermoanaerobaculia bacterium]